MGGLRRRRAEEAEEEAVGALMVALRISMEEFHKPELALLDTSKLKSAKKHLAENGLRTACWVTLPRRVVL